jgi:transposase-like protein
MRSLANELAKDLKTEKDVDELSSQLMKLAVEAALGAEMEAHLGYAKHQKSPMESSNAHNGYSTKRLKRDHGEKTDPAQYRVKLATGLGKIVKRVDPATLSALRVEPRGNARF